MSNRFFPGPLTTGMSSPGRPKSEYRSAQHEGTPASHACDEWQAPEAIAAAQVSQCREVEVWVRPQLRLVHSRPATPHRSPPAEGNSGRILRQKPLVSSR